MHETHIKHETSCTVDPSELRQLTVYHQRPLNSVSSKLLFLKQIVFGSTSPFSLPRALVKSAGAVLLNYRGFTSNHSNSFSNISLFAPSLSSLTFVCSPFSGRTHSIRVINLVSRPDLHSKTDWLMNYIYVSRSAKSSREGFQIVYR